MFEASPNRISCKATSSSEMQLAMVGSGVGRIPKSSFWRPAPKSHMLLVDVRKGRNPQIAELTSEPAFASVPVVVWHRATGLDILLDVSDEMVDKAEECIRGRRRIRPLEIDRNSSLVLKDLSSVIGTEGVIDVVVGWGVH